MNDDIHSALEAKGMTPAQAGAVVDNSGDTVFQRKY